MTVAGRLRIYFKLPASCEAFSGLYGFRRIRFMEPLLFHPILKRIRWGGRRLGSQLHKPIGPETDYAESWEIADHGADQSVVASGSFAGQTLAQLIREHRCAILGNTSEQDQFPLLIKYLDANDWLSLQVHPDDTRARHFDSRENGKTEAWVIMDAAPGSRICSGLQKGVTESDLRHAIADGELESCLHIISVSAGDCVYVPAGTVHALGPGILLAEIQQQSNLTFRLHDWGRVDSNGLPRPVHIEESIACTNFLAGPVNPIVSDRIPVSSGTVEHLVRSEFFTISRHHATGALRMDTDGRFRILMVLEGEGRLTAGTSEHSLRIGTTVLLPAERLTVTVSPVLPLTFLEIGTG